MVELGRRNRFCTPSIEVIDKLSKDDNHERKGLWTLAEGTQLKRKLCLRHPRTEPAPDAARAPHIRSTMSSVVAYLHSFYTARSELLRPREICILHATAFDLPRTRHILCLPCHHLLRLSPCNSLARPELLFPFQDQNFSRCCLLMTDPEC